MEIVPGNSTSNSVFRNLKLIVTVFLYREDMYAQESIDLLSNSGIKFDKLEKDGNIKINSKLLSGIEVEDFGELLMTSGSVLTSDVRWVAFHGGYDFGYLLKVLTNGPLPVNESEFFDLLKTFFPFIYDIKYLMKSCDPLKGGLNQVAEDLNISRIGPAHQAGSDSLLTSFTFFKMMSLFFENKFDDPKNIGVVYGLGSTSSEKDGGYTSEQTKEYTEEELGFNN
jgi:CCR4-NOT transcription complex subunit 7/8